MINPMNPIEYVDTLITSAMKASDKDMLAIYRLAKSELIKQQKDKGTLDQIAVFKSMKKKLLEEIDGLEKAGRDVSLQKKHLEWVESQLPAAVSEESIKLAIKEYITDYPDTNIGKIMGHLKLIYTGQTLDMGLASKIAKEMLG
ncbi:MAG: GatB/YqeY domain-containing protein [Bacilli bacterium]|nr:GatB/YqeY domain-containing protein [Bacilli bacterium]